MNREERQERLARMKELMEPITQQIYMCDDQNDLLMLASCLLVIAKDLLDQQLGSRGRKLMFSDFV